MGSCCLNCRYIKIRNGDVNKRLARCSIHDCLEMNNKEAHKYKCSYYKSVDEPNCEVCEYYDNTIGNCHNIRNSILDGDKIILKNVSSYWHCNLFDWKTVWE